VGFSGGNSDFVNYRRSFPMVNIASYSLMRPITLRRHLWLTFRPRLMPKTPDTVACPVAVQETKPRAPTACTEERFWAKGKVVCGIVFPNRFQALFFVALCSILSLPVFLLDESGRAMWHGFITMASIAAFVVFCWLVGMLLASTSECSKAEGKRDSVKGDNNECSLKYNDRS
jgi:hypothetical protein